MLGRSPATGNKCGTGWEPHHSRQTHNFPASLGAGRWFVGSDAGSSDGHLTRQLDLSIRLCLNLIDVSILAVSA